MFEISPTEWTAVLLSLRVAVIATLVATPFGIALAWLLARRQFWGKSFLDAAVHLHGVGEHERRTDLGDDLGPQGLALLVQRLVQLAQAALAQLAVVRPVGLVERTPGGGDRAA